MSSFISTVLSNIETKSEAVTEQQKKQLKQTELDVRQSTQKMRDLSINIKYALNQQKIVWRYFNESNRLKEALIKQLVKNGHEAEQMNRQYEGRISNLEDVGLGFACVDY